ncbi:putative glutamate--cysteine ligase 2 [Actinoplanes italicus]|uniref:Putative glutamate--cysteine ligase 2 n=1 Tax=Actinoplanes italicus TaxID=113567 RepID=A0A2T0JEY1_9ACTN|nr:glutamate--cysteine ligase [Actinoplanes italicus]PRX06019.1 carboxylate-amine ligase [Actinoplanes italicus]GIE36818.1 putative glutamate--cysteine ligase 2 [Actinoplanes italicus]
MRTLGVEEEFLLLDALTGMNRPVAEQVAGGLAEPMRARSRREFRPSMLEMVTGVCTGAEELAQQLRDGRRAAAQAARAAGVLLVPVGATPVAEQERAPSDDPRFLAIESHYGPIARDPSLCGCHIHVGVDDPATAVAVCTRLRADLPLLQALACNSPLWLGADTGYASWRGVQLRRWQAVGPWPHVTTPAEAGQTIAALVAAGEMMDESMVLWWARPSRTFPTVEVRVADVCPDAADTVVLAALTRAMVDTAVDTDAPPVSDVLLNAAHGNAARSGMRGTLLDPRTGRAYPAWDLVGELVERVTPALKRHEDLDTVTTGLQRIQRVGTGADRQRRLLAQGLLIPKLLASMAL